MSSRLPDWRPILYAVLTFLALFIIGLVVPKLIFASLAQVSGFGNFGVAVFSGLVGALIMLIVAPACSGFLLARTALVRPMLHLVLAALTTLVLLSIAGYGPFSRNWAEARSRVLYTLVALAFAAAGAWLGYRRQVRLNDEQLIQTLRSLEP